MTPDNIIQFPDRHESLGTYHAVSSRDAASVERDGQSYVAMNPLNTADDRPLCQIQFTDGMWLLADPTQDLQPR